eukprot:g5285.t1
MAGGADGQNEEMEVNKRMLRDFFGSVAAVLAPPPAPGVAGGEVHITHKTKPPFSHWRIVELAARSPLLCGASVVFDRSLYPGYINMKVLDGSSFPCADAETFIFSRRDGAGAGAGACEKAGGAGVHAEAAFWRWTEVDWERCPLLIEMKQQTLDGVMSRLRLNNRR